jgi:phytoene dehydrogenase-like protein
MDDPMLFIGTPTLHHTDVSIAPAGHHQMIVVTLCSYDHFRRLKDRDDGSYEEEKSRVVDAILDKIEREFIPDLRSHIDHLETGTPTTNERYVATPRGNAYGQALTPENIRFGKLDYRTPWPNLFLVGATAGIPSFGGGLHCALLLFEKLAGVKLKRGTSDATRI